MSRRLVKNISFDDASITLAYMDETTDFRDGGMVYQTHQISISREAEVAQELREVEEAVEDLLQACLRRWSQTPPVDINDHLQGRFDFDQEDD